MTRPRTIRIERDLIAANDGLSLLVRGRLAALRLYAINVMGTPGAGKTALLEQTIAQLRPELPLAVLEGDQATDRDAERIRRHGCAVVQINTGAGCHLDAGMILRALDTLAPPEQALLFIENVGNLVCPALFDLGEHKKVVVTAVTEGEDKPIKYPHMFRAADLILLTKIDLLPHVIFDRAAWREHAGRLAKPGARVLELSALTGAGMDDWCAWLKRARSEVLDA